MTVEPGWVPSGIDTSKANIARVYDYWLGGSHNFRADQDAARTLIAVERVAGELCLRSRDQIASLFDGFSLVRPGLVWMPEWRPGSAADVPVDPQQFWGLVGVGQR
jgi:hypothetical protein